MRQHRKAHDTRAGEWMRGSLTASGPTRETSLAGSAFEERQAIPQQYTCDGVTVSPPLEWRGVPKNAKTLAIICDDPDAPAGTWVHWVLYNLPAGDMGLIENAPGTEKL